MKFTGICIITEDVSVLAAFYKEVLQAEAEGDSVHTVIQTEGAGLAIYSKNNAEQEMHFDFSKHYGSGNLTLSFAVADVDVEYERLKKLNAEFVAPPKTYPWGSRSLHFRDPDGNIVTFFGTNQKREAAVTLAAVDGRFRGSVIHIVEKEWAGPLILSKGKTYSAETLPGFVYLENNEVAGVILYHIENTECEIVAMVSYTENKGYGKMLLEAVFKNAREVGCRRVRLVTTNDNTQALRYYQKRGFTVKAVYPNAIETSRLKKPQIPLYGIDGIPILDEIELEKLL